MLAAVPGWLPGDWPLWLTIVVTFGLFVTTTAISLLVTGWVIIRLPADYFVGPHPPPLGKNRLPALRIPARIAKNLLGAILVIGGFVMLFTPGQGVLTMLLGLMLLDLPAKRRLEKWLIRKPNVHNGINRLRVRYGAPPLIIEANEPQMNADERG